MDKIQNSFEFRPAFEARAAFLFLAYHPTSRRRQRLDLGIEVLIRGRSARISDFDLISVHFGCGLRPNNQTVQKMCHPYDKGDIQRA